MSRTIHGQEEEQASNAQPWLMILLWKTDYVVVAAQHNIQKIHSSPSG